MPITFLFVCMVSLGVILLVPILPISLVLLGCRRRWAAFVLLGIPVGMIGLSICLTILVFVMMWFYGMRRSSNLPSLFEDTFGFAPPTQTEVLAGHAELGMDWEETTLRFRAPREIIDRITTGRFTAIDRATFVQMYEDEGRDLPRRVQAWFLPVDAEADCFYVAQPFDRSVTTHNEAILCYNENTGIACFHWMGLN